MNISSLVNDEPAKGANHPPARSDRPSTATRSSSGVYSATPPHAQPGFRPPSSTLVGHAHQPPSIDTRPHVFQQPSHPVATPILTPSHQSYAQNQYPFPAHAQSPLPPQSARPLERYGPPTPSARPAPQLAPNYPHQVSPSLYHQPLPPQQRPLSHHSQTPPSALPQSPHPLREGHHYAHTPSQYPHNNPHGHSQPSTPLGPPSIQYQRPLAPNAREELSPFPHQRSHSGASASAGRSIASSSPGAGGIAPAAHRVESPASYVHPSAPAVKRPSTDYIQHAERARSSSISPKTQVNRRQLSGTQEQWSARSSLSRQDPILHQNDQPPTMGYPASLSRSSTGHFSHVTASPLSQVRTHVPASSEAPVTPVQRHMAEPVRTASIHNIDRPIPLEASPKHALNHEARKRSVQDGLSAMKAQLSNGQPVLLQQPVNNHQGAMVPIATPNKRRAEETPEPVRESKKARKQYSEPPVWARYHFKNRLYPDQLRRFPSLQGKPFPQLQTKRQVTQGNAQHVNGGGGAQQSNGHGQNGVASSDMKKAMVSHMLGMPWELSIRDTAPADKLLHGVADFLYKTMLTRPQLGAGDPRNGSLEIEAKVGTLIDRDAGERLRLPVESPCLLNEGFALNRLKFESFMDEAQHKALNERINGWIRESMVPPRVPMQYRHRYERDSFATLSPEGIRALPPAAHDELERLKHDPRHSGSISLRTSIDVDPKAKRAQPPVIAQIVKLRLADLDIFCPSDPFDIRISVNIEIDFHGRGDVDPATLTLGPGEDVKGKKEKDKRADRYKDRLSYKHLAYSIDLTQVSYSESRQGPKTHELEVEVDAAMLRSQAERLRHGEENAFEALVEGLLNNVFLLSRLRN